MTTPPLWMENIIVYYYYYYYTRLECIKLPFYVTLDIVFLFDIEFDEGVDVFSANK